MVVGRALLCSGMLLRAEGGVSSSSIQIYRSHSYDRYPVCVCCRVFATFEHVSSTSVIRAQLFSSWAVTATVGCALLRSGKLICSVV